MKFGGGGSKIVVESDFTWLGEYNGLTEYNALDAISYEGSSYIANQNNVGKTPGVDPEWTLWVSKGEVGIGIPIGGATGQVLVKKSIDNYDTEWIDQGIDEELKARVNLEALFNSSYNTAFHELIYNDGNVIQINVWQDDNKIIKLFTQDIIYDGGEIIRIETIDERNSLKLIKTINYDIDGEVESIEKEVTNEI